MEIKQLRYFIAVAEREHISEAALYLNVAQSAVSRQIAQLEKELHVTLFKRIGRNIKLTDDGHLLLEEARAIIERIEHTTSRFQINTSSTHDVIRIGYQRGAIEQVLPGLIQSFEKDLTMTVIPSALSNADIEHQLQTRDIDIAISGSLPKLLKQDIYEHHILYEEFYHLLVHKSHPLALTERPTLAQLKPYTLFQYDELPSDIHQILYRDVSNEVITLTTEGFIRHIILENKGIVIFPTHLSLKQPLEVGRFLNLDHTELRRSVGVTFRRDNQKPYLSELIALIHTLLSKETTYY
ncbi:glutamate biosynthesis transcriptional regulator GltC [Staphylococcus massiliensis]|uniref:Transcription activator of glutamate synthase operon n=1 Tax=Staphylococcus massiliensis S46 TaxID=1229783 RepID=K9B099_9STAP|nr:LysR family transcriptional regulator [Staphylococcus massiliensis]EKU48237.1 transcription activator of glutamate synthase operon [Staphylococcus massiliensis S46]MCG3399502.1 LysR family transcriptional regulator [Staphylococcus massiliensis]MCG3402011.1 LysR family transcriptional regulator [Staphylococcus massiliensis]MCG3412759.1 LysR family transcriptional regulator [Staphylococcus massiliensis]PNZ99916.1 LysR family transcriptional regulator [Staphylococcus massiliensis CCUG 55927]